MPKKLLNGKRVIAIDDEIDILSSIEEILDVCKVVTASDFNTAKKLLNTQSFDIAIIDIMGVDGYALLDIATKRHVIPVILTAHALGPDNIVRSFKNGAASYVPKEELVNLVSFLTDILEAKEAGKNAFDRWLERMGSYCESNFGPDWQSNDKDFWINFKYLY